MSLLKYCFIGLFFILGYTVQAQEINWMTWEQAAAANEKAPRKIFVDIYTVWCGWCKRMDATTFRDPAVARLMNEKFYAVKLNAEQKETIRWRDLDWVWVEGGRNGVHKLAYELLDGRLSFPSFVMLDEKFSIIATSPGFKDAAPLLKELQYACEDHYKTTKWDAYLSTVGQP